MMQSRSRCAPPSCGTSEILSGRCIDKVSAAAAPDTVDGHYMHFVAENEEFIDAVAKALDQLTADCKTALRWSCDEEDANAAIQAAEHSFYSIASICKEAGLTVDGNLPGRERDDSEWKSEWSTIHSVASSCPSLQEHTSPWSNELERANTSQAESYCEDVVHPPPAPIERTLILDAQQGASPQSPTEEIVEVELTDLLTQSHEEILGLQRVFEARMSEAERNRMEYEHKHAEEMQSLQEELVSSRLAMDRIKQELLDSTTRKLEDMHSAITTSQRAIEASMKDQARYWKSICEELVVEKRDMAQKVAEERGKYTALKAHLASHNDANARTSLHNRVRIPDEHGEKSAAKMRLCELSPPPASSSLAPGNQGFNEESAACTSICGTPTGFSSGPVVVPDADSVSEPSSAEVSPTHSSSSSASRTGKPTAFRRYYLAQKRVVLH
ncbi:hypothetical protein PF008_g2430 [Phytophthora fragariae]|uniref:Uncharacterized protein n=1 Tax=Phytophthora fragariae TaxID=53985 RepID=A0A6G0SH65_9STRA|nr:hypothetical protein PF008_g2430 [Phytophthora fragariae]